MRAYIYVTQRDLKFARADYERLLKLDPQNYNARLGLATLEQKDGNLQKGLGEYSIQGPDAALYVDSMGMRTGYDVDLAMIDLEEALKLNPSDANGNGLRMFRVVPALEASVAVPS